MKLHAKSIRGKEPLPGTSNYFLGKDPNRWMAGIPSFSRVEYRSVYPGVDLTYYHTASGLEYDFVVAPGADPRPVRLFFEGARKLAIAQDGSLNLSVGDNSVRMHKPIAYQSTGGRKKSVSARFVTAENGAIGFALGAYDRTKPLIIDPVLTYSTYLGGSADDSASAVAIDLLGNIYVTGSTMSIDFPLTGPYQTVNHGTQNVFVAKLNAAGSAYVYSTYLGGSGADSGLGIGVDAGGYACITGAATSPDFPTLAALQPSLTGPQNAFVAKLNAKGSGLVYSTYLGGSASDQGNAIASDASGNCYVTGSATSPDFPVLAAIQPLLAGGSDAFLAKINAAGTAYSYSTFLGGSANDSGRGIAVDASGSVYLTGDTASPGFPTRNAIQAALAGGSDAFVAKVNAAGTGLAYATFLGGSGNDTGRSIAVDSAGGVYVTGDTASANFPLANPIQAGLAGGSDAFVTEINPAGTGFVFSTYLGGSGNDLGRGIAVDGAGNAYIAGETASPNFPLANPLQLTPGGGKDAFVTELAAGGAALAYSTNLGGSGDDSAYAITTDQAGDAFLVGSTASSNFPTVSAVQPSAAGGQDAFIAKVAFPQNLVPVAGLSPSTLSFANLFVGQHSQARSVTLANTGLAPLAIAGIAITGDFSQTNTCGPSLASGASCGIAVTFSPSLAGVRAGAVTITDNAGGSPRIVSLTGTGIAPVPRTGISISPVSVKPGSGAITLKVYGSGFVTGAVVNWNGRPRPTSFVSSTLLNASIPASDLAGAGTASITVTNPVQFGPSLINRSVFLTGTGRGVTASQWPQQSLILYNREDSNQCDQIHSIHPDGTSDQCLTCGVSGWGGGIAFHNGKLSPDGNWLLMQVTIAASGGCASPDGGPGTGNNQEVWVASYPNLAAHQLRVSPACVTGRCQNLIPIWHPKQTQIAFGNRQVPCVNPGPPACAQKMAIANVSFAGGVPALGSTTIVNVNGANPGIVEPWSWKVDGSLIWYSGQDATHPYPALTVNSMALSNGSVNVLTPYSGANVWNEFPTPAPNGSGLFFSSTRTSASECPIPGCPSPLFALDELGFMNLDGSHPSALTGLNVPGSQDYAGGTPTAANGITLNPAASQGLLDEEIPGAPKWISLTGLAWPTNGVSNPVFMPVANPVAGIAFGESDWVSASSPGSVATGDFNGDGKADVAAGNPSSNNLSVLLGNGDGTFAAHKDSATGTNPVALAVGDFNGDGKLDLATANAGGLGVSILLGNGDGTLRSHADYATGNGPSALVVGDFNLDGKLDLAVVNKTDGTVSILLGNGDGTFQTHTDWPAGTNPVSLALGDFNADGAPDLAVVNNKGAGTASSVSILFGKGNGTFYSPVPFTTGTASSSIVAGDFNADGNLDLAVANSQSNTVSVLLGIRGGTFQTRVDYATGLGPTYISAVDLNADGSLDLLTANPGNGSVSVLFGNGTGTFAAHNDSPSGVSASAAVADFNNDGLADITAANSSLGKISVFLQSAVRPASLTLSPSATYGGLATTANNVALNNPAPAGGTAVSLTSSSPAVASVPASVTVPAGSATSPAFSVATSAVSSSTVVAITATYGGVSKTANLTLAPAVLYGLSLSPSTVTGGTASTNNQVSLAGFAPPGGAVVTLTSSNPAVAQTPASVVIPANQSTSPAFTITTSRVSSTTSVTITASYAGKSKTGVLTVK
jgi:hypothetical protein